MSDQILPPSQIMPPSSAEEARKDLNTLAAGTSISLIGRVGGRGIHALTQVILARWLGPSLFGLYALGWTILQLAGALSTLGLNKGAVRFGTLAWPSDPGAFKSVVTRTMLLGTSGGLFAAGIIFLSAEPIESLYAKPGLANVLRLLALALPFFSAMTILVAATQVSRRMQYGIYVEEFGRTLSNLGLVVLALALGYGLLGATAATVLSFVIGFVLACIFAWSLFKPAWHAKARTEVSLGQLLRFSLPTMLADTLLMMTVWINPLLIGLFLPSERVGVYQALSQVPILFSITLRAINTIFSPFIVDLYHAGQMVRLESLYRVTTRWAIILSMPVFVLLCFAAEELILVIFGPAYSGDATVLVVLAIAQMINVSTGSVAFMLIMTGHQRAWLIISVSAFLVNTAINIILLPRIGILGTALAALVTISLLNVGGLLIIRRRLNLWPYERQVIKVFVAGFIAAVGVLVVQRLLSISGLPGLVAVIAVDFGLFISALVALGLDEGDREFVNLISNRLRAGRPNKETPTDGGQP